MGGEDWGVEAGKGGKVSSARPHLTSRFQECKKGTRSLLTLTAKEERKEKKKKHNTVRHEKINTFICLDSHYLLYLILDFSSLKMKGSFVLIQPKGLGSYLRMYFLSQIYGQSLEFNQEQYTRDK